MAEITIIRENNYLIRVRPLKVFIDNNFVDYIEPSDKEKKIIVNNDSSVIEIKVNNNSSNKLKLDESTLKGETKIKVTSQVQNGLLIFIYACFFGGLVLKMFDVISNYLGLALVTPMFIIVYLQTLGRKNYLRISKIINK